MKRTVLAVLGAVLVAACGGGGGGGHKAPPPPATGTLKLVNGSSYNMDEIYVVASTDASWGSTLGAIPSGNSMSLGLVPGSWDVRGVSYGATSTYFADYYGADIVAGSTFELDADDTSYTGSMKIVNANPTYSLTGVYVVYSPYGSWGTNWLSSPLPPSTGYITIMGMPATATSGHTYDVQCVWAGRSPSYVIGTSYYVYSHMLSTLNCN
jgi:hypothetical protein